jgi:hypothetical protein
VKVTGGGVTVDHQYGMTIADLNNLEYRDEPFALANDVNQVFYVKDMSTKLKKGKTNDNVLDNEPKRRIVLLGKETSWESKTGLTCQKIMKRMMKFYPS